MDGIQEHEVKETLKSMNNGKKVMYANIQVKLGESFGETGNGWLTKNFNEIMRPKRMSDKWEKTI